MRLHRLTVEGVGPFLAKQTIDFNALADAGLFLIDGPTGSGKTTIIDAIVYALYGELAGGADASSSRVRSNLCGADDSSVIELEFTVAGRRHIARRVPQGSRDPERPRSASTTGAARLVEILPGGETRTLTQVREIRAHVESLLGMPHDQFTQLVVLPQGKFAELLRMRPLERQRALEPLLDPQGLFAQLQQDLADRAKSAQGDRARARAAVGTAADRFAGQVTDQHVGGGPAPWADPSCADADRIDAGRALLARLAGERTRADEERELADAVQRETSAVAQAAQAAVAAIEGAAAARDRRDAARAALTPPDDGLDAAGVTARIAALGERAGALEQDAAWEAEAPQREQERARGRASAAAAREHATALRADLAALPDRTAAAERDLDTARIAAARLPAAAEALTAARERVAAVRQHAEAVARLRTAEHTAQSAALLAAAAAAAVTEALDRYRALGDQQRAERASFLAQGLQPGQPCPVCGATEHPAPAQSVDTLVTDEQVRRAGEEDERCRREQALADEAARGAADDVQAAGLAVAELAAKAGDVDETEVLTALARVETDHELARLADDSLEALERGVRDLREQETLLGTAIAEAERDAATADARVEQQESAERERTERIAATVGDGSTATVALAAVRARLALLRAAEEADAAYARAAAAIPADLRDRGIDEARQVEKDASTASEAAQARHRAAVAASARLKALLDNATPLADEWEQALQRSATVDESTRGVIELAALAGGGNARRLSLSSYALMRRFESVLNAASQHLARMSAGRFTFTLDTDAGQGQAGLGIAVIDGWSGQAQEPKSLSGGETFYAALALALGLADVVRSETGGSPLETLFIDEGFGSLDQDTLGNVMQQLDTLRSGSRVVGVISHVTEMKDSIHSGISVRRGDDRTSTIGRLRE